MKTIDELASIESDQLKDSDSAFINKDGTLYIQHNGKFIPYSLIQSLSNTLRNEDYNEQIITPSTIRPGDVRVVPAYRIDTEDLVIGVDGVLYDTTNRLGILGLYHGKPIVKINTVSPKIIEKTI